MSDFITLCAEGRVMMDEIDDFVDRWHQGDAGESLREYLGMNKLEYNLWVADPNVLAYIVSAHRSRKGVTELMEAIESMPLAARSSSVSSAVALLKWLRAEKLVE
jgi:hypothetical protein